MSLIKWTDDYLMNVAVIDAQHKRLVELINEFHETVVLGKDKAGMGRLFTGLIEFTQSHFATEEQLFASTGYPDAEIHARQHQDLVRQVLELKQRHDAGRLILSIEVHNFLKKWLIEHLLGSDKRYVAHFAKHGVV